MNGKSYKPVKIPFLGIIWFKLGDLTFEQKIAAGWSSLRQQCDSYFEILECDSYFGFAARTPSNGREPIVVWRLHGIPELHRDPLTVYSVFRFYMQPNGVCMRSRYYL